MRGGGAGERVGDGDEPVAQVDGVGGGQLAGGVGAEAEVGGGLPEPAGGGRGSGGQEPAEHGAVQVAQRAG